MMAGPADDRPLHDRAGLDHHLALDAALGVHLAVDAALERVEDQAVGLEHVFQLAGVLPPALDDVRLHGQAAIDQILDRVGDLQLVPEAGLDPVHRLEDLRAEHVDAHERQIADRLLGLLDQPDHPPVLQLRHAEHLRVGHLGQQDLRGGLLARELLHEAHDALVQQVVAEIHHERLVPQERLADLHGVRQAQRASCGM